MLAKEENIIKKSKLLYCGYMTEEGGKGWILIRERKPYMGGYNVC